RSPRRGRNLLHDGLELRAEHLPDGPVDPRPRLPDLALRLHELELAERGPLDDLLGAGLLADPRKLHDDPVRPDLLDQRLLDTELVDSRPDDLQRAIRGVRPRFGRERALAVVDLEREVHPSLEIQSERQTVPVQIPTGSGQNEKNDDEPAFQGSQHPSFPPANLRASRSSLRLCDSTVSWWHAARLSTCRATCASPSPRLRASSIPQGARAQAHTRATPGPVPSRATRVRRRKSVHCCVPALSGSRPACGP